MMPALLDAEQLLVGATDDLAERVAGGLAEPGVGVGVHGDQGRRVLRDRHDLLLLESRAGQRPPQLGELDEADHAPRGAALGISEQLRADFEVPAHQLDFGASVGLLDHFGAVSIICWDT
jgi:hypothetical protein